MTDDTQAPAKDPVKAFRLTGHMGSCLSFARRHPKLVRHEGGFWSEPEPKYDASQRPNPRFLSKTIYSLIQRDLLEVVERRAKDRVPIVVKVTELGHSI